VPEVEPAPVLKYCLLFTIFVLALMIRLFSVFQYEPLLKAFDPWYQYRVTEHIVHNGFASFFTWHDTLSWYPYGRRVAPTTYPGTPFTVATIYLLLRLLGINVNLYVLCVIFPAIMGALTCIMIYNLGCEFNGAKTGLMAAFLLAFSPAYISRTMAGFYDNEALGIFLIITTLLFFIKGFRHDSMLYSIMSGLSLGYLGASWGTYTFMLAFIPLIVLVLIFLNKYSRPLFVTYSFTILLGLFIMVHVPRIGIRSFTSFGFMFPLGVLGLLVVYELMRWTHLVLKIEIKTLYLSSLAIAIGLTIGVLAYAISQEIISLDIFTNLINPLERPALVESVSEHQPLAWSQLFFNLDLVVFLLPVGVYFAFRRFREDDIILVAFALLTLYFSGSLVRLLLIVAPAACLVGGYGLDNVLRPFSRVMMRTQEKIITRRRGRITPTVPKDYAVFILIFVGFILSAYTWHGVDTSFRFFSTPDMIFRAQTREGEPIQIHDWQEGMMWLREETPDDSVVLSWWDYGYWIQTLGNRTTLADGSTNNGTQIGWIGAALMLPPENSSQIFEMLGADYVLVHFTDAIGATGGDEGKWLWMVEIAEKQLGNKTTIKKSEYFDETTGDAKDRYYESLLFYLLYYNSPRYPQGRPVPDLPINVQEVVTPAHITEHQFVKIYKVN
jgi:dolichyl-diphosphooligosaccharide--protein glycosyltransferase